MKTKPMLESNDAGAILDACRAAATAAGLSVSIAVVDDGGYALRLERMDGAGLMTPAVASAKARTAALMRAPSKVLADRVRNEPEILRLTEYLPMPGGLPILVQGHCAGGVGISGGRPEQDEEIARAGLAALG
ncbi:MAG: heme-binding protein [Rhizomicrobium sp.]